VNKKREDEERQARRANECSFLVEETYQSLERAFRNGSRTANVYFKVPYITDEVIKCAHDILIKDHVKLTMKETDDRRDSAQFTATYLKK
jgi:hypothetical protein